jgi:hypothetical protein
VSEQPVGWDSAQEKLRCMVVLDDPKQEWSHRAAPAYFRAFIVENRKTGAVTMRFRYRYVDPAEDSWFKVPTEKRGTEAVESFRRGMEFVLTCAGEILTSSRPKVRVVYPPDDGGDTMSTLNWLLARDMVEIVGVEGAAHA